MPVKEPGNFLAKYNPEECLFVFSPQLYPFVKAQSMLPKFSYALDHHSYKKKKSITPENLVL